MSIQDKATIVNNEIAPSFGGDTPLIDIQTNAADPLVNLVTTVLAGQMGVEDALKFLESGLFVNDVEGQQLTLLAQLIGTDRRIDQQSKVPIIVMGATGAVLPAETILLDSKGNEWVTTLDAVIQDCYGYTNACSPVGRFDLKNGELYLQNDAINITKATNAAAPQLGGEFETDESLRRRLLGRRPQWKNKGTQSELVASLLDLPDVLKAKVITDLPDCFNKECNDPEFIFKRFMVAVLGGDDQEIANAIFENLCFGTDRLAGDTSVVVRCDDVKFQRFCPTLIQARYWLSCECPAASDNLEQQIADQLNAVSLHKSSFGANDLCKLSKDIIKVEFRFIPRPLAADCAECPIVFDNPITGEEDQNYCVSDINGHCLTSVCVDLDNLGEYQDCLILQPWWYGVFLPEFIVREEECPCPQPDDSCGCALNA